jgi:tRNA(fMet)-specific endonuclease VapC
VILLDTSILIDYFRKKDKSKSVLFKLSQTHQKVSISTITEFEIYTGTSEDKKQIWNDLLKDMIVLRVK